MNLMVMDYETLSKYESCRWFLKECAYYMNRIISNFEDGDDYEALRCCKDVMGKYDKIPEVIKQMESIIKEVYGK